MQSIFTTAWVLLLAPVAAWQAAIAPIAVLLRIHLLHSWDEMCNVQIESFIASLIPTLLLAPFLLLCCIWGGAGTHHPSVQVDSWEPRMWLRWQAWGVERELLNKDAFTRSIFLALKASSPSPEAKSQSHCPVLFQNKQQWRSARNAGEKRPHSRDHLAWARSSATASLLRLLQRAIKSRSACSEMKRAFRTSVNASRAVFSSLAWFGNSFGTKPKMNARHLSLKMFFQDEIHSPCS